MKGLGFTDTSPNKFFESDAPEATPFFHAAAQARGSRFALGSSIMQHAILLVVMIAALAFIAIAAAKSRKRLSAYWQRSCMGREWKRSFPSVSKEEIREFLDVFLEAFLFKKERRLCFGPKDKVMDIYHACYPPELSGADALELEAFARAVLERYDVDLRAQWRDDITLGEIFGLACAHRA